MKLASHFERLTRNNGETFYALKGDAPEWLQEAVQEAHLGDMPNDWIYSVCHTAACSIDDGALTDADSVHGLADSEVDIYTANVFQWAADMSRTDTYSCADSERLDCNGNEGTDPEKAIQQIQYFAAARIMTTILTAWEDNQ